jgi:hypothetical protein
MVKKTAVILGILAMLAVGAGMSWGYTVSKWPAPGIANTSFEAGGACLPGPGEFGGLRGPVAPACEPSLLAGTLHAALAAPFTAVALVTTPLFIGSLPDIGGGCCNVELGAPAYVTAAVPCTAVNRYVPPCGLAGY